MQFLAFVLLAGCLFTNGLSSAAAQSSTFPQADGTTATLSPLGGNEAIHSDAHGHKGVTHQGSGLPSHTFSSPNGAAPPTVTPFGTSPPPNFLTPAPLLPLQPRGMATPQPHVPTPSGASSGARPSAACWDCWAPTTNWEVEAETSRMAWAIWSIPTDCSWAEATIWAAETAPAGEGAQPAGDGRPAA